MPTCVFKTDDIVRCLRHTLEAENWEVAFLEDTTPRPGLFFVHDNGVYMMSNGLPRDRDPGDERAYVAYAENCDPTRDPEWWHNSAALVGGDDFVETLPVDQSWLDGCEEYAEMHVHIVGDKLDVTFANRRTADSAAS